jgi:hypothetical protein
VKLRGPLVRLIGSMNTSTPRERVKVLIKDSRKEERLFIWCLSVDGVLMVDHDYR